MVKRSQIQNLEVLITLLPACILEEMMAQLQGYCYQLRYLGFHMHLWKSFKWEQIGTESLELDWNNRDDFGQLNSFMELFYQGQNLLQAIS